MDHTPVNTVTALQNPAYKFNPRYHEFTYTLAAGEVLDINADTDFVSCLSADYDFGISFDNGTESTFKRGLKYMPGQTIRRVTIRNTNAAVNMITLGVGMGDIVDSRLSVPQEMQNASRVPDTGFWIGIDALPSGGVSNIKISSANSNRREIIIHNNGDDAFYIKFEDTFPTSAFGLKIEVGEKIALEHAGDLWVWQQAGANMRVSVVERGFNLSYITP